MSFIFMFIKQYWLYILVALVVGYGIIRWTSMEKDILTKQAEITQLKTENDSLKKINEEAKKSQANLDIGIKTQTKVVSTQSTTRDRIHNVPVQKNDKPFSDPGLLARASILRDHQIAAYPES